MTTRSALFAASLACVLLLPGCPPGPLPEGPGDGPDGPGPAAEPPGSIQEVDPATVGARRLAAGLRAGDRIVRQSEVETEMDRVGPIDDLPAGQILRSTLYRKRRFSDEILSVADGRPTSVRRTYFKSFERARLELTGGGVQDREGASAVEGARVRITRDGSGRLRAEGEELPPGVTEADLDEILVLDAVALSSFVPGREAAPGDAWEVDIERFADLLGKRPPDSDYAGTIDVTYVRRVLYDGVDCAHLQLVADLTLTDRQEGGVPFRKTAKMLLTGQIYHVLDEGRPIFATASGPYTIDYQPTGDAPPELATAFTLQGQMRITIGFERLP